MEKILFFDGICAMCNGLVDFVFKHDKNRIYKFATLQGKTAAEKLPNLNQEHLTTVVLMDEHGTHTESDAVLRLLVGLGGYFSLAKALFIFPRGFRNLIYRFIAKNRYRWFGTTESCRLLTDEERKQILD